MISIFLLLVISVGIIALLSRISSHSPQSHDLHTNKLRRFYLNTAIDNERFSRRDEYR